MHTTYIWLLQWQWESEYVKQLVLLTSRVVLLTCRGQATGCDLGTEENKNFHTRCHKLICGHRPQTTTGTHKRHWKRGSWHAWKRTAGSYMTCDIGQANTFPQANRYELASRVQNIMYINPATATKKCQGWHPAAADQVHPYHIPTNEITTTFCVDSQKGSAWKGLTRNSLVYGINCWCQVL